MARAKFEAVLPSEYLLLLEATVFCWKILIGSIGNEVHYRFTSYVACYISTMAPNEHQRAT